MVQPSPQTGRFAQAFQHAVELHKAGRAAEAAAHYESLVTEQPRNAQLLYLLGAAYVQLNRGGAAIPMLEKSLKLQHDFAPALDALGAAWIQSGQPAKAVPFFRRAAQLTPNSPDILDKWASALMASGDLNAAETVIRGSIARHPSHGPAYICLGTILGNLERFAEAEQVLAEAVRLTPQAAEAWRWLGVALHKQGRLAEAVSAYQRALALKPSNPMTAIGLGTVLGVLERFSEAEQVLAEAVRLSPQAAEAWRWLGVARHKQGRMTDAVPAYRQTLALDPSNPMAAAHLGEALVDLHRLDEAEDILRKGLAHAPTHPGMLTALGRIHELRGDLDEAIAVHTRGIAAHPTFEAAYLNRGNARRFAGDFEGALADYATALALKPTLAQAHANRGLTFLLLGRLAEAWPLYRARIRALNGAPDLSGGKPWDGAPLNGKRVLAWGEYGLGDEIMFASLLPELIKDAAHVTLACAPRLATLFKRSFPEIDVVSLESTITGDFDARFALIDAAAMLRPDFAHFPAHRGYLRADPALTARLRARYKAGTDNLLVGLSWRSASGATGRFKSADLSAWKEILGVPGINFVSLQYGDAAADIAAARLQTHIAVDPEIDSSGDLDAFAAQVAAMDLVISVSNTTVHVAGALGKPVWVLTPTGPGGHWYWFRERGDSPWYPSARLFRQSLRGSWDKPLADAAAALKTWTAA